MKTEFAKQYGHSWGMLEGIVKDFDKTAWIRTGREPITPARLAFHILKSIRYYIEDSNTILFDSGISIESNWETVKEKDLPSQSDIVTGINELKVRTEKWLSEMDFHSENKSFEWVGETKLSVVLFLLSHTVYHIGELGSLLNESRNGEVEDHYIKP
jgi:hypothetical protein